ncbi:dual specificity protein kinase shkE-like [Iris pallida]|uniref:Dual specificity protein kinase shkE-like n=1 Tax=Iris pallida TaxID=29817 RepID=A0AAX6EJH8_IRIPA|nr:dual specificity protein kinase shkE-like [Iris pallida]
MLRAPLSQEVPRHEPRPRPAPFAHALGRRLRARNEPVEKVGCDDSGGSEGVEDSVPDVRLQSYVEGEDERGPEGEEFGVRQQRNVGLWRRERVGMTTYSPLLCLF